MRFGSCCSGIEAASVAWEPLGMKPAWFSEIEAFPSAVLAHHWPDVPNLGDMLSLPDRVASGDVSAPDVLVGGTPCQAFSVAGARKGLADDRGQLTIKFVELANAIDAKRVENSESESIVVWENVPGVLSSKDNAFGAFLGLLSGEDCALQPPGPKWANAGYVHGPQRTIAWRVLDAQYFGVAQRRRRVFVVASARANFNPAKVLFEREGLRRDTPPSRDAGQNATTDTGSGVKSPSRWNGGPHPTLNQSHNTGGTGASNQELFSQRGAGIVGVTAFGQNRQSGPVETSHALNAHSGPHGRLDFASETFLVQSVALRGREGGATAELGGEVATALRASTGGGDKPHVLTVHGTQDPCVSDSTAFALGRNNGGENAVYAPAYGIPGNWIGRKPENGGNAVEPMHDLAPCQTVADRHGVAHDLAVRRLTPVECERLQGFNDNHTNVIYRKKPAADGPRYKAIGNSMAVPCMSWIGARISDAVASDKGAV